MACKSDSKKSFSFLWILENYEYCWQKTGSFLKSPTFIVDTIERTKWSLSIYPRGSDSGKWVSLFLRRETDSKGPATVEVDYEMAFIASDGSSLRSLWVQNRAFPKNHGWGIPEFQEREAMFAKQSKFLPQGVLTIQCRILKSIGEIQMDEQCIARTRINVEKKAFLWEIKSFSTFDIGREKTFRLKSTSDDKLIMTLILFLRAFRNAHVILIKFVNSNENIGFSTFKPSVVNAIGDHVECGKHEFWVSTPVGSEEFTLPFLKDTLMKNNNQYLPNDALTLFCEQAFSTGTVLEGIEGTSYGCSSSFITNTIVPETIKSANIDKSDSKSFSDLEFDLSSMLQENILCGVKLCTESETFPSHWFILSSRSPVFRAMFKSDMKEKASDRIDIVDLKPETVRRMLLYMYTDSLEELQWEIASDLYVAAEKYQITSLKYKCASFLKTNLSLTNACEVLLLADLHHDKELKSTVQDFILDNDKSIINSSEWKLLMQTNVSLAAETMLLKFKD